MMSSITLTAPEVIRLISGTKAQIVSELCERLSAQIAKDYHGEIHDDASSSSSTPASPIKTEDS